MTTIPDARNSDTTFLSLLRVLRLARIFKLLKMGNASESLQLVSSTAGAALLDSVALLSG